MSFIWMWVCLCDCTYHVTVVCPRTELHEARLLIEGKVLDVDFTEGFVDGGRFPNDFARMMKNRFGHYCHFVVAIGAENGWMKFENL